jgi:hypothetical protein
MGNDDRSTTSMPRRPWRIAATACGSPPSHITRRRASEQLSSVSGRIDRREPKAGHERATHQRLRMQASVRSRSHRLPERTSPRAGSLRARQLLWPVRQESAISAASPPLVVQLGCHVRAESDSRVPDEAAVSRAATVGLGAQLLRSLRERHVGAAVDDHCANHDGRRARTIRVGQMHCSRTAVDVR